MAENRIPTTVSAFIQRSFHGHDLKNDDDIFALGFTNSLFAMQLVAFVEQEFGIEIDSDDLDLDNFRTVNAIAALVDRKLAAVAS
jgi:methoxymalonate biosynthesis acyl carrier protein